MHLCHRVCACGLQVERTYWALTLGCPSISRSLSGSSLSSSSSMKQRGSGAAAKRGNVNRGMAESRSSWGSSGVADGEAPSLASGRVETNIVRDANDRKRMAGTHGGLCIECIITCPSRCCLYCVLVKGMRTVYYHGSCSQHCLSGCLLRHGVLNSYV